MIAHTKTSSSLLVLTGFIVWLGYGRLHGTHTPWQLSSSYFVGAIAFFLVACFLPDRQPVTFLSRRSALGLMSFFQLLATQRLSHFLPKDQSGNPMWDWDMDVVISIAIAVGSYWLSIFLIRRFRMSSESTIIKAAQGADGPPEAPQPPN